MTDASSVPGTLDSHLLRTFLAIADAGSFTRGADRVFRSQSAVSLQVKHLEAILGHPVFERHGRGVRLTRTGEALLPVARKVVGALDSSLAELRTNGLKGRLRIGIPDEYGKSVLSKIIGAFARNQSGVELVVRCAFSAGFPVALESGALDVAVHEVEDLVPGSELLREERVVWAASRHHHVQHSTPLPVALFDRDCWWRSRALEALEASGRPYRVVYSSESVSGVRAAIEAGIAVGLLGHGSLGRDLTVLDESAGFGPLPSSKLVLDCRDRDAPPARAMAAEIRRAFGSVG